MLAANVTELCCSEFGKVGLKGSQSQLMVSLGYKTYIDVEAQDRIFLVGPLQASNLGLQLVLGHMLSLLLWWLYVVVSGRVGSPILLT